MENTPTTNIFLFSPLLYLGRWSNLIYIFQTGWNHQLDPRDLFLFGQLDWFHGSPTHLAGSTPRRQVSVRKALLQFEQIPDVSVQRAQFFLEKTSMGRVYIYIYL